MSKKNEWTPLPQINTQPKKGSVTWNVTRDREAEIQKAKELGDRKSTRLNSSH